jgi:hypothetical protein
MAHVKKKPQQPLRIAEAEKKLGSDLLSHTLAYSTIGDERLDF